MPVPVSPRTRNDASVGAQIDLGDHLPQRRALSDEITERLGLYDLLAKVSVLLFELGLETLDLLEGPSRFFFALLQGLIGGLEFRRAFLHAQFQRIVGLA